MDGEAAVKRVLNAGDLVQVYDIIDGRRVPGKVVPVVDVLVSSYDPEVHSMILVKFPDGFLGSFSAYEVRLHASAQCPT